MSTTDIIEEIKKLSSEEQQKIAAYLNEPKGQSSGVSEEFKRVADEVFTQNAELFRKLAK